MAPHLPLNTSFAEILSQGTGTELEPIDNDRWTVSTRPMLEAYFHARYFLEMVVKYGKEFEELDALPQPAPSGWAAVLCLFNLRR